MGYFSATRFVFQLIAVYRGFLLNEHGMSYYATIDPPVADPGFLERGFALLVLSFFSLNMP